MMLCAVYCRLSREDEDRLHESESIQNQKLLLTDFAHEHSFEIYKTYCDEDYSGADRTRPAFCRMLSDAEKGMFQVILCKTQSRFTRDMEIVEKYLHGLFPLWGIRFIAVVDNVDTAQKGNKKARQISGLVNEWYLEDLSENIRTVFDQKRRSGLFIGSFAPYGYEKHPQCKNKLIVDDRAADVVRQIFRWSLEGYGKEGIAVMLNDSGVPNPTKYKKLSGLNYVNANVKDDLGLWNKTTVGRILKSEIYLGTMVQGKRFKPSWKSEKMRDRPCGDWIRVEHTHEAIIDVEMFRAVQERLSVCRRSDGRGEKHPLSGKVRCLDCGSVMSRTSNHAGDSQRTYLRCSRSKGKKIEALCTRHSIRLDQLTEAVREKLATYAASYGDWRTGCLDAWQPCSRCLYDQAELEKVQKQIKRQTGALHALYLDRASDSVGETTYAEIKNTCCTELKRLSQREAVLLRHMENQSQMVRGAETGSSLPDPSSALTIHLADLFINKIEIGERDPVKNEQRIRITWKF